ncbi:hypothetical protein F5B20DRAFT_368318 [Whalleya microplaca]|nr:hypothetical protein F5B20DRAFT_368318 [Whalleya microplaca]
MQLEVLSLTAPDVGTSNKIKPGTSLSCYLPPDSTADMPLNHDPTSLSQEPSPPAPTATATSPTLLTLPLELRLEILSYLLILPSPTPHKSTSTSTTSSPSPPTLHPAILRTNHQLHAESLPLLYRHNTFLAHTSLLTTFPRLRSTSSPILSPHLTTLITRFRVRVRLDAAPGYDRGRATQELSGKEEVVLDAWQAVWRGSGPDVLRLFDGVRGVRRARVVGSVGGFEEYARWLEGAMMARVGERVEPFFWDRCCGLGTGVQVAEDVWAVMGE